MKDKIRVLVIAANLVLVAGLVAVLIIFGQNDTARGMREPQPIEGGTILQTWGWSFNAISENMPYIASAGWSAIQTSPIMECITSATGIPHGMNIGGPNGIWYLHYQPVSMNIGNFQLGTREEFIDMLGVAEEYGVKVLVDAIPNHMTAYKHLIDEDFINLDPGNMFHTDLHDITNWSDRRQVTQRRLLGLWDLNTHNPVVQQAYLELYREIIELGASGFRFDAAKHIELPGEADGEGEFGSDYWSIILDNGSEFQYGEVLGNRAYEGPLYLPYMPVTDNEYGSRVRSALQGTFGNALFTVDGNNRIDRFAIRAGNDAPERLVLWVESHDCYANAEASSSANLSERQITIGWALVAAREGSAALFFSRPDGLVDGRTTRWGNNIIGERGNNHFKSPEISAINHFNNAMRGRGERLDQIDGVNSLIIERGSQLRESDNGAILINGNISEILHIADFDVSFLADGSYYCRISGAEFVVSGGRLSGQLAPHTIAVIYEAGYAQPVVHLVVRSGDVNGYNNFSSVTFEIELISSNVSNAFYSINGSEPVAFENGEIIMLGRDTDIGEGIYITLTGEYLRQEIVRLYSFYRVEG